MKMDMKALRKGYHQGKVGAHTDGGMENSHGRSESLTERRGHEVGKVVRSRVDGLSVRAKGLPNQRTTM